MTYALVNYGCFDVSLAKASGWRSDFRYYNKWLALTRALLCVTVMFIINRWAALITFVVNSRIFLYVRRTKLVLTGNPIYRPTLVDLCSLVTYGHSLMIMWKRDFTRVIKIIFNDDPTVNIQYEQKDKGKTWLKNRTARVFYQTVVAPTVRQGVISLFQATIDYFNIIHDTLHLKYGIGILRLKTGHDFSHFFESDSADDDVDDDEESTIFNSLRVSISQNNNNINNK
ncbi:unnamed protein product [Rotaria sp. Silwood2]|nr:unnamed protein product [Rotaria sp. Silwood2]CAF4286506.1 unnamed protein product [Rotaria sp. Silwood2]CAF4322231.1 unnamed protein product [Rotaria sp. Silwood2]CAF4441483.1 unnamed protein product [Rotaria sp. Silwood2]